MKLPFLLYIKKMFSNLCGVFPSVITIMEPVLGHTTVTGNGHITGLNIR